MSPWGLVTEREAIIMGRKHISYDVGGVTQLDYLNLYKKFTCYNKNPIVWITLRVELGQKKLDASV